MNNQDDPSTPRQAEISGALLAIVARILGIDQREIDPEMSFLELGSDSLVLVELLRTIYQSFGVQLSLRQVFEELPSIAALADHLGRQVASQPVRAAEDPAATEAGGVSKVASVPAVHALPDVHPLPPESPSPRLPTETRGRQRSVLGPPKIPSGLPSETATSVPASTLQRVLDAQLDAFQALAAQQLAALTRQSTNLQTSERPGPPPVEATATSHSQSRPLRPGQKPPAVSMDAGPKLGDRRTEGYRDDRKQRHLEALIERFTRRTAKSKQLAQSHRAALADSRAVVGFRPAIKEMLYPLARQRAAGSQVWDIDGNQYIDITMGMGVHLFGHRPEFLTPVLEHQLHSGFELGMRSELAGEVAALVCQLTGMERAAFTNSGTEAVMTAIRLSRAASGKQTIALFAGSYHGHSDGTLIRGQEIDGQPQSFPVAPGVPPAVARDVLVLDYGSDRALEVLASRADDLAAVLVEPVQSRRPNLQPRAFLHQLRQLTRGAGVALIFDEMITGFRLDLGGAQAFFDVRADLATYGKVVGGGLPIGVVAGRADYMDGIDGGMWRFGDDSQPMRDTTFFGGTFCQHPLAMASARAVLGYLAEQGPTLQRDLNQRSARFVSQLNEYFSSEQVPIQIAACGSLFRFTFTSDAELFFYHLVEKGIYVWEWRNCFLSTAHSDDDLKRIMAAIRETVTVMREGGFLSPPGRQAIKTSVVPAGESAVTQPPAAGVAAQASDERLGFFGRRAFKPGLAEGMSLVEVRAPSAAAKGTTAEAASPVVDRSVDSGRSNLPVDFSLYYFGNYKAEFREDKYDLLFEGAKFADRHGFAAIWFPERHFHPFGGLSPNPSVLAAALARETQRLELRAGSVVLPLHHPVRVAEEWALVDNLAGGRVGLSVASGWHPNDFVLAPHAFGRHRELMFENLVTVQRLWRGEDVEQINGNGKLVPVRLFPQPQRRDLPIWITVVNNPDTYRRAGTEGCGILTNLMAQTLDGLASNIACYRQALADAGHASSSGQVTVLLHTFVDQDAEAAVETARKPFYAYLESSVGLLKNLISTQGLKVDFDQLADDDRRYMLELAYERYVKSSALIGSPSTCAPIVEGLRALGVDEIACLIDFGVDRAAVMAALPHLDTLRRSFEGARSSTSSEPANSPQDGEPFPLTEGQKQLRMEVSLDPSASMAYNETVLLRLQGELEVSVLIAAVHQIIVRHVALRTVLDRDGESQRVVPMPTSALPSSMALPVIDLSNSSQGPALVRQLVRQIVGQPFDLEHGPYLIRLVLIRIGPSAHLLSLTAHHIAADGASIAILVRELLACYDAGRGGRSALLPRPLPYRQYVEWLDREPKDSSPAEGYWLGRFAHQVPVFEPPTDRPRPPRRTFRGRSQRYRLNAALVDAVETFGRREGSTFYMTMLAAFAALLHRWTEQAEVIVGVPVQRRPPDGGDRLVGHCVDAMPMLSRCDAGETVSHFLAASRRRLLDAQEHGTYPLVRLIRKLNPPRDLSRAPLVNVVFNFDLDIEAPAGSRLELTREPPAISCVKYDLALHAFRSGRQLVIDLESSSALFDATTTWRLLGHFRTLLYSLAEQAGPPAGAGERWGDRELSGLSLLAPAARHQVLVEWSCARPIVPERETISEMLHGQVEERSEAVAVVFGAQHLSYQELRSRAESLARLLTDAGAGSEASVGICLQRSLDLVVAIVGVLEAGCVYVPLDPEYPAERLAYIAVDAGLVAIITNADLQPTLPALAVPVIAVDGASIDPRRVDTAKSKRVVAPQAASESLAYIMFTSGSTGQPKGVAVPHRAVVRLVRRCNFAELGPEQTWLQLAPASFDASTLELWAALLTGGRLVVAPPGVLSPQVLGNQLTRYRVTSLWLTAGLFHLMVEEARTDLQPLQQLLAGGDVLSVPHVRRMLKAGVGRLVNGYGPTENTTFTTCHSMRRLEELAGSVPIGRPIGGSQVLVVDAALCPVPIGFPGELWTGGEGLARGYHAAPRLSAERFVPHPSSDRCGQRLYRTGDRVRFLADGRLQFLGRSDQQVKVRGFRIEPGEIESTLMTHATVVEAAVVMDGQVSGESRGRLLAFVVVAASRSAGAPVQRVDSEGLRQYLADRLPAFMVPTSFVMLDRLPLTPNGKVDRRALKENRNRFGWNADMPASPDWVAPRTPTENMLADIWSEVLGGDGTSGWRPIGAHDNFFALGGHSLLATQVVSRVRRTFGVELAIKQVFEGPTIAELASDIQVALAGPAAVPELPLEPVPRDLAGVPISPVPLSFPQQRLWFVMQLQPDNVAYNIPAVVSLRGPLDGLALERSWSHILRRHEPLRTVFRRLPDGQPTQHISPPGDERLPVIDLTPLTSPAQQRETRRLIRREALRPFDLEHGPLARVWRLRLATAQHVLFFNFHHIVFDGWSQGIFDRELEAAYRALTTGETASVEPPALGIQYGDFSVWQHQVSTDEEAQLAYWRDRLTGLETLSLPVDRPRPAVQTSHGAAVPVRVPAAVTTALRQLGVDHGLSLFMPLLASFQILLQRASGQLDVTVGSPIAHRNRRGIEQLIGFFVNNLVLRSRVDPRATFLEFAARTRNLTLADYAHQDLPFERLVEALQPERDLSRHPLFQVFFSFQNTPRSTTGWVGLERQPIELDFWRVTVDLELHLWEEDECLQGLFGYNSDLFDRSTIERLERALVCLLTDIVTVPKRRCGELQSLRPTERHQTLLEWSDTPASPGPAKTIPGLVLEQAARCPEAVAVVCGIEFLSYGALMTRTARLADQLQTLHIGPENGVGMCLARSLDVVPSILGILTTGAFYVPLDPEYPEDRLAFMASDAGITALVTTQTLALACTAWAEVPTVRVDVPWETESGAAWGSNFGRVTSDGWLDSSAHLLDSLAYVMYTSGSTGQPKGVAVSHRAVIRLVHQSNYATMSPEQIWPLLAPISFDASTLELWAPLLTGGRLAVAPPGVLPPEDLSNFLSQQRVNSLFLTTGLFNLMVDEQPAGLRHLDQLFTGGEELSVLHARQLLRAGVGKLFNVYGPTENTTFSTFHPLREASDLVGKVPIGRPIGGSRVLIVDPELQPVSMGAIGELCTGGVGVARGYWRVPRRTALRFVPDPTANEVGARIYRTGDRARWRADGQIEFLGRFDHQFKLRGFRIEPGEIEAALMEHPRIADAAVVLERSSVDNRGISLAAYIVASSSGGGDVLDPGFELVGPSAEELRALVGSRLPNFMVPSSFTAVAALPLTPTGKVDRTQLARGVLGIGLLPEDTGAAFDSFATRPHSPIEEILVQVWNDVFRAAARHRETIGVHDNFFAIGGHSLLATQVISRVRVYFDVDLPLASLFEQPTIAEQAAAIQHALAEDASSLRLGSLSASRQREQVADDFWPLSFAQQRLWFLDQLMPSHPGYNMPSAYRLVGHLDVAALAACWQEILRRHEVLRTSFPSKDGRPYQRIEPNWCWAIPLVDLTALSSAERGDETRRLLHDEVERPFDLTQGPLARFGLIRLHDDEHILVLNLHHVIFDGWSMGVFQHELETLYKAILADRPSPLPELPVQYRDFALWQRQQLSGGVLAKQLAYWRDQLANLEPLELPLDRQRPATHSFRGAGLSLAVDADLTMALEELSRRCGVSLFMTLLGSYAVVLQRMSGQGDLVVGSPIAHRNHPEIEGLLGFFVNNLVLRLEVSAATPFLHLLDQVRAVCLAAYGHQDLPFDRLVDELHPERDLGRHPLFQTVLAFQNTALAEARLPGIECFPMELELRASTIDLAFHLAAAVAPPAAECADQAGLVGLVGYNTDIFDPSTILRLSRSFQDLLANVVANPERRLGEFLLLKAGERHQLLVEWNNSRVDTGVAVTFPELFRSRVRACPEAVALRMEDVESSDVQTLTYGALEQHSNRLAETLRRLGVRAEKRVGLAVDPSPEMIIGLLAILHAGGVYVPLDPALPDQRLAFIVANAGVEVVLTQHHYQARVAAAGAAHTPCLVEGWPPSNQAPSVSSTSTEPSRPRARLDNLAYIIYTSGSTGRPKGVLLHHRGLYALQHSMRRQLGLRRDDRMLQFASLSFDASIWEIVLALATGATLELAPRERLRTSSDLLGLMTERGITVAGLPPAMLAVLEPEIPSLRLLLAAGEACTKDIVQKWAPGRVLFNGYGPTESTVAATFERCDPSQPKVLIGRPFANIQATVLGAALQPAAIGAAGELHLAGAVLARGYLDRPRRTARHFIPDPMPLAAAGTRLYCTGDRVRRSADGRLDFLGRVDQQVKIRGFRIEPGEIEAALLASRRVREAVVVARQDSGGPRRLVAYVVAESLSPSKAWIPELRAFLEQQLPRYMVPAVFVELEALPLLVSGKVDRRSLPIPEPSRRNLDETFAAPTTEAEKILAKVWCQLLRLDRVGVHDNFFTLGGDSILTIQIVARARQQGLQLTARDIFRHQTIHDLVRIAKPVEEPASDSHTILDSATRRELLATEPALEDAYPLAPTQLAMFHLQLYEPASRAYFLQLSWRISGRLEIGWMRQAWQQLMARHPILRTSFRWQGLDRAHQVVHREPSLPWHELDLRALTGDAQEAAVETFRTVDQARGVDFSETRHPVMRLTLIRLAEDHFVFNWSYHHILLDGWSMPPLLGELFDLYRAGRGGGVAELQARRPYRDYIAWLEHQDRQHAETFWRRSLRGVTDATPLPKDRSSALLAAGDEDVDAVAAEISAATSTQLDALARRHRLTVNTLVQAAWAQVLGTFSGVDEVLFGVTFTDRPPALAGVESMIGLFINTLPASVRVARTGSLLAWVKDLQAWNLEMRQYGYVQLFELRKWCEIPGDQHLFETALIFENLPESDDITTESLGGGVVVELDRTFGRTHYPLVLIAVPSPPTPTADGLARSQLTLSLAFDRRLFDRSTVSRMFTLLDRLLTSFVTFPDQSMMELPRLSAAERHQVLVETNDTEVAEEAMTGVGCVAMTAGLAVTAAFRTQARQAPDTIAVAGEEIGLSYGELLRRVEILAFRLRAAGLGTESRVGLYFERSPEMVVALLAVLDAGAAYVPLDPRFPKRRLASILETTEVPIVLTVERMTTDLPAAKTRWVCLDRAEWNLATPPTTSAQPDDRLNDRQTMDRTAYVITTSGSTGQPKGVMISARSLAAYNTAFADALALSADDRVLQFASLSFDTSAEEIFPCFARGATLILRSEWMLESPRVFFDTCRRWRVTILDLPSAYWHQLVAGLNETPAPESLRWLVIGGEAASASAVNAWRRSQPGVRLVNTYGPSESTIVATREVLSDADKPASDPVSIGQPIRNTRAVVLDRLGRPVPVGVAGELCLAGVGLARGYLRAGGLTAARFVPDPWVLGGRLYHTGDRVKRIWTGALIFLGRLDHQIKIRGQRVELGEIESALREQTTVSEAVVVVVDEASAIDGAKRRRVRGASRFGEGVRGASRFGEGVPGASRFGEGVPGARVPGASRLVACVVAGGSGPIVVPALRQSLHQQLPRYMVPDRVVVYDELPLTAVGKIDRAALISSLKAGLDPDGWPGEHNLGAGSEMPSVGASGRRKAKLQGPIQELLAEVWGSVLGIDAVGPDDNFFDLGGHSLLAAQVISRVRQTFDVEITLRELFQASTLRELASRVESARFQGARRRPPPLEPAKAEPHGRELPLSFAQQRLWFLDRLRPASLDYNLASALRLRGALQPAALAGAWREITRRHESLRTTIASGDGGGCQRIGSPTAPLPVVDLETLTDDDRQLAVGEWSRRESRRPFDLERGPLARWTLLRLTATDHVLLSTLHHIISDGWSSGVVTRELGTLYRAACEGVPSPLPPLKVQYADYAIWQRDWLQGEVLHSEVEYWRRQLAGLSGVLELPIDRRRPSIRSERGALLTQELPSELSSAIQGLGRHEGATLFMVYLAAFQVLLGRLASTRDVCVGSPVAGRNQLATEGMIGFFVNTLVLRGDLSRGQEPSGSRAQLSFRSFLRRLRDTVLEAHEHQEVPFEKLVEELLPQRDLSHTPLFQVMFTLETLPDVELDLPGLTLAPESPAGRAPGQFDLTLALTGGVDALVGSWLYSQDLFDTTTIRRWGRHFEILVQALASQPDQPLVDLALLSVAERQQLTVEWRLGAGGPSPSELVHRRFALQAARTPEAIAVIDGEGFVTLGQLASRGRKIARTLVRLGVGPEVPVAVFAQGATNLVLGLLGVLEAGGVYIPLETSYPASRLSLIMRDAEVRVVLSDSSVTGELSEALDGLQDPPITLDIDDAVAHGGTWGLGPASWPEVSPEHLAYVIYTSGSTGEPKGVGVTHRQVMPVLNWFQNVLPLPPSRRVLQHIASGFDASVLELAGTLVAGGTLICTSPEQRAEPATFAPLIRRLGVEILYATPTVAREFVAGNTSLPSLRVVVLGGETVTTDLVDLVEAATGPRCRVLNGYGPTETAICATATRLSKRPLTQNLAGPTVPIGRAMAGAAVQVLDRHAWPVLPGVHGELTVSGSGVARGYLNQPRLTAEQFVPDVLGESGQRAYRTGDIVRFLAEGRLEFQGRADHQVKVRGLRLETEEVEAVLRRQPGVEDGAVVAVSAQLGMVASLRLVGFVKMTAGAALQSSELRQALAGELPQPMVPSTILALEQIPRTSRGKINRQALQALARSTALVSEGQPTDLTPPRNRLETILVKLWEELLEISLIGVHDDFFALGGHSLLTLRLQRRIAELTGQQLAVADIFKAPTVEKQAALLNVGGACRNQPSALVPLREAGQQPPLILVHAADGMATALASLARCLPPDRPCYALQSIGLEGTELGPASIEAMAAAYLEEVLAVQPTGPWHLAGWSMGGLIAFEMAQQLRAHSHSVALLALLDTQLPLAAGRMDKTELLASFARHLGLVNSHLGVNSLRLESVANILALAREQKLLPADFEAADGDRLWRVFRHNVIATAAYAATPYDGRATLFIARQRAPSQPSAGWGRFIRRLEVVEAEGNHFNMVLAPQAAGLAGDLEARCRRNRSAVPASGVRDFTSLTNP